MVNRFGAFNAIVFCSFACSALLFSMLAVVNITGVVVFSLLFGFFSGACECSVYLRSPIDHDKISHCLVPCLPLLLITSQRSGAPNFTVLASG